jgi:hypothetical protein
MTITINLDSAEQEKVLFDFLERMNFDYQSDQDSISLTESQKEEILRSCLKTVQHNSYSR